MIYIIHYCKVSLNIKYSTVAMYIVKIIEIVFGLLPRQRWCLSSLTICVGCLVAMTPRNKSKLMASRYLVINLDKYDLLTQIFIDPVFITKTNTTSCKI